MYQVLFQIPNTPIRIYGFGFMLFLALVLSLNLASWRARKGRLDDEIISDLAFAVILCGLVGARFFYVVQHRENIDGILDAFKFWNGGIVLYGSFIGAGLGYLIVWWRRRFPFWAVADAIAPAMALGVALGRVGCFLNGCCFGDVCDPAEVPWAMTFPAHTLPWLEHVETARIAAEAPRSLPVHPTQLYSAVDGVLLMALLLAYFPLRHRDGQVFALLLVTYPISRFLIEHLRADEGVFFAGMTISQTLSFGVLTAGVLLWAMFQRRPAGRHADGDEAKALSRSPLPD